MILPEKIFDAMLKLRFAGWVKRRRNLLARRRYAEKKLEKKNS